MYFWYLTCVNLRYIFIPPVTHCLPCAASVSGTLFTQPDVTTSTHPGHHPGRDKLSRRPSQLGLAHARLWIPGQDDPLAHLDPAAIVLRC